SIVAFIRFLACASFVQKNGYAPGVVGVNLAVSPSQNMPSPSSIWIAAWGATHVRLCGMNGPPFFTCSSTGWLALTTMRLGSNQNECATTSTFCTPLASGTTLTSCTGRPLPEEQPAARAASV